MEACVSSRQSSTVPHLGQANVSEKNRAYHLGGHGLRNPLLHSRTNCLCCLLGNFNLRNLLHRHQCSPSLKVSPRQVEILDRLQNLRLRSRINGSSPWPVLLARSISLCCLCRGGRVQSVQCPLFDLLETFLHVSDGMSKTHEWRKWWLGSVVLMLCLGCNGGYFVFGAERDELCGSSGVG